nr:glutamate O-methyltransferase [Hydrometra stagnorum]
MEVVVDEVTPLNASLSALYKRSFAYATVTDRLPVIITTIIDYLARSKRSIPGIPSDADPALLEEEIKDCTGDLSELKYLVQTAKPISYFTEDDCDTQIWNSLIKREEAKLDELTFYTGTWMFVECYMYRRVREIFYSRKIMKEWDPFGEKKMDALDSSLPIMKPLVTHLQNDNILDSTPLRTTDLIIELTSLLKHSLWANRMDLSLLSGNLDKVDHNLLVDQWNNLILLDDSEKVLEVLFSPDFPSNDSKIIDYVLDNAGLELLCDLCLADFLTSRCKISKIRFRVKRIPWFVSDVTVRDFNKTLDRLMSDDPTLQCFAKRWKKYLDDGIWSLHEDPFWCLGVCFDEMPELDPSLYSELEKSHLLVLKGDLNYRKLVQDKNWLPTESFGGAIGRFQPCPFVALRTNKADTIAGLPPGVAETVSAASPDWLTSGQYGIIQFHS